MKYAVRTSWSEEGRKIYGERWVRGFNDYWPEDVGVQAIHNEEIYSRCEFFQPWVAKYGNDDTLGGSYDKGAVKWFHKVAALTMTPLPDAEWMLWIDGDVEFTHTVTHEWLDEICSDDADLIYLGRPWAYASETGFVAYRLSNQVVPNLLQGMLGTYLSGEVFAQDNWGDGFTFDRHRNLIGGAIRQKDLCAHLKPENVGQHGLHVWPKTALAKCMRHNKGPTRKTRAYGSAV